jgi:hypothetical protein
MEWLFAVTRLAKSHSCDKYLRKKVRLWCLYTTWMNCYDDRMCTRCVRCDWLMQPGGGGMGMYVHNDLLNWLGNN